MIQQPTTQAELDDTQEALEQAEQAYDKAKVEFDLVDKARAHAQETVESLDAMWHQTQEKLVLAHWNLDKVEAEYKAARGERP